MTLQKTNQLNRIRNSRLLFYARAAAMLLALGGECYAQTPPATTKAPIKETPQKLNPAAAELQERLDRAQKTKAAGNPAEVAHASELVIALALRELGQVRLLESAYPQAVELYGRSLDFENIPDTRVDLAIAQMRAGQADKAIEEVDRALLDDPNNLRAFEVLGHIWLAKNDYSRAVRALSRAAEISPSIESLYSLAIAQLGAKDPAINAGVDQTFARMVKLAGNSGSLHVMFGRAYRDANNMPAAIREFETAIKLDTRTQHAHYFLGLAHLALNEWVPTPEVTAEFQKELEFFPRDYLANYMMGFLDSAERKYDQADKYLKLASTLNPDAPEPWLYLGLNAYAQSDMNHAEEYFRKAIQLTGSDEARSNYQIRRAYIDLGRILSVAGNKEEAEIYLDKARALQNKVLESSQQGMASHFAEEGAEAGVTAAIVMPSATDEKAAMLGTEVENVDPFAQVDPAVLARSNLTPELKREAGSQEKQLRAVLAQSYSDLATSEAIRKDYPSALSHYQDAERWDPAIPGLMRDLGVAGFRAQNYPEAIRGLSAQLAAKPDDGSARAMLGMAYFAGNKYKEAVRAFGPLGKKGMQDSAVGYAWAVSLTRLGELARATEVLGEFSQGELTSDLLMLVGQLWIEIADYGKAVATFRRLLEKDPAFPKAHYFTGQAYLRWEHWEDAAREFQAELALVPDDAEAKYNLGFVYLQQSRTNDAENLFQQVIAAHPDHANAQYEYGKILLDRGELEEAIAHLEAAARLSPEADFVHYQLQAAYRKSGRVTDADRELGIYKKIKAKQRERATSSIPPQSSQKTEQGTDH